MVIFSYFFYDYQSGLNLNSVLMMNSDWNSFPELWEPQPATSHNAIIPCFLLLF